LSNIAKPNVTRTLLRWLPPLVLVCLIAGGWEIAVRALHTPDYLLPAPSAIVSSLVTDRTLLEHATGVTLVEVLLGYAFGVAVALLVATAIHFSRVLRQALLPLLVLSQTIPTVIAAPILTILLGFALAPKVVIVGLVCFFPIVVNAVDGLRSAEPSQLELMDSLAATRGAVFRLVAFPTALPAIFSGARVAATYAAVGAVFAEWAGSSNGLGFVILQAQPELETARIFAAVAVVCLIALVLYGAVALVERIVIPRRGELRHA